MPNELTNNAGKALILHKLDEFVGGWLVGHFQPTLLENRDIEVAVKIYPAGAHEKRHYHAIATEYTVIATGRVRMNNVEYAAGDNIQINPGNATDFEAIEPTTTVVIKSPSVPNDKFIELDGSGRSPSA